jgi:hypothetical protein
MQSLSDSLKYFQLQEERNGDKMANSKRTKSTKNNKRKAERLTCISKDLYDKPVSEREREVGVND